MQPITTTDFAVLCAARKSRDESVCGCKMSSRHAAIFSFSFASRQSKAADASLTVRRAGSKVVGGVQHVLAQQLCVGGLGGELPVKLVVDELLYPGACTATGVEESRVKEDIQKIFASKDERRKDKRGENVHLFGQFNTSCVLCKIQS